MRSKSAGERTDYELAIWRVQVNIGGCIYPPSMRREERSDKSNADGRKKTGCGPLCYENAVGAMNSRKRTVSHGSQADTRGTHHKCERDYKQQHQFRAI